MTKPRGVIIINKSIVFNVKLDKETWRNIQISLSATFEDLHLAIFEAYNFYDEHLYAFFMDNKIWSDENAYWSPYAEDTPYANEIKLSSFNFTKGKKFKYLFDFGDGWKFQIKVVEFLNEDTAKPIIVNTKGEAPPQYPIYEE